jgi:hypothetical protein
MQRQTHVAFMVQDEVRHCVGNQHVASDVEFPLVEQKRFVDVSVKKSSEFSSKKNANHNVTVVRMSQFEQTSE